MTLKENHEAALEPGAASWCPDTQKASGWVDVCMCMYDFQIWKPDLWPLALGGAEIKLKLSHTCWNHKTKLRRSADSTSCPNWGSIFFLLYYDSEEQHGPVWTSTAEDSTNKPRVWAFLGKFWTWTLRLWLWPLILSSLICLFDPGDELMSSWAGSCSSHERPQTYEDVDLKRLLLIFELCPLGRGGIQPLWLLLDQCWQ